LDSALLVCAVAATRFTFRSHYLYDIDSVNFALGMGRFDPRVYQPHPPAIFSTYAWDACPISSFTTQILILLC
jgi:hypothetical protein